LNSDPRDVIEYIIAITNNNDPLQELREKCQNNLREILGEDTESIVNKIINLLQVEDNSNIKK